MRYALLLSYACVCSLWLTYNLSSFAILDAISLNPIDVPEILLNLTPLRESLGSLQTSISHWTSVSVFGSPCTHKSKNLSRCS